MFGRRSLDQRKRDLHQKLHHKFLSTYGAVYLDFTADQIIIHFDFIHWQDFPQIKKSLSTISEMEYNSYARPPFSHGLKATTSMTHFQELLKGLDKLADKNTIKLDEDYFKDHVQPSKQHGPPPGAKCMPRKKM